MSKEIKRPLPQFGRYLRIIRRSMPGKPTMRAFAKMSRLEMSSAVERYERGEVLDPTASVLREYAALTGVPLKSIVNELVKEKYGIDFTHDKK